MSSLTKTLDFMIIGVGKSGTTTLADMLSQHPNVVLTDSKEPWFFDTDDYNRGMGWYWEKYLAHYAGEEFVGEASSQTLFVPYTAKRIKETAPDARLIAVLRDPVSRAYSDWWMKHSSGKDKDDFETAIQKNFLQIESGVKLSDPYIWQKHIESHNSKLIYKTYIEYGLYAKQLRNYLQFFSSNQILIILAEDLRSDPKGTLKNVLRHIGVDNYEWDFALDTSPKNVARTRAEIAIRKIKQTPVIGFIIQKIPSWLRRSVTSFINNIEVLKRPPIPTALGKKLSAYYASEIKELEALTGRDLTAWLTKF